MLNTSSLDFRKYMPKHRVLLLSLDFLGSVVDGQRIFVPHAVQMRYKYRQKSVKMHRNLTISLNGVKIQHTENQLNSDECIQMPMRGYFPMQNMRKSVNRLFSNTL